MGRDGLGGECLELVPGKDGLKRAVGTAPAIVIEPVMHVVKVEIVAFDQSLLAILHVRRLGAGVRVEQILLGQALAVVECRRPCRELKRVCSSQHWSFSRDVQHAVHFFSQVH